MIRSAIVLLSIAISLSATTINVPADQTTIQAGIDAAVDGDEVLVQAGTYQENINFNGKNIILSSSAGAETTIIQSSSGDAVITGATDSTAALIGFTITSTGLGINAGPGGSTRFEDLIIQNCGNRGMYLNDYHGTIKDVHIKDNLSDYRGGGVHVNSNSDVIFYNVIFSSNSSTPGISGGGLWIENSDALFRNCLLYNNSCGEDGGGLAAYNSNVSLISSTITKNTQPAGRYGAGVAFNTGTFDIINSIIYGNEREGGNPTQLAVSPPAQMNVTHSCVGLSIGAADDPDGLVTLWPGIGNINVDPLFEDSDANDFRLSGQSSCLGNGFDTTGVPTLDLDGQNRPQPAGSSPDMGAYEHSRGRIPLAVPDRFATIQAGINAAVDGDTVLVQPGTYVENINFNGKNIVVGSLFLTSQDTSYISQTIIDGNQGGSVVIFDSGETADAVLTGLTLRNGRANFGGGIHCETASPQLSFLRVEDNISIEQGGGLSLNNFDGQMNNLEITGNTAAFRGGGIYANYSEFILRNSFVLHNESGQDGGGIYPDLCEKAEFINVLITENQAGTDGGGIGIENSRNVKLINSTITQNYVSPGRYASGLFVQNILSSLEVYNSIITNNINSTDFYVRNLAPHTVVNSCIGSFSGWDEGLNGIWPGASNIVSNVVFTDDDYTLNQYSPCLGAGLDTSIVPTTDIEGNPRPNPAGSNPDMGAYENILGEARIPMAIYVPNDYSSIQEAINAAYDKDTVYVQPGNYPEYINITDKSTSLISTDGPNSTILQEGGYLNLINSKSFVSGFTIKNAHRALGIGNNSNVIIENMKILNTQEESVTISGNSRATFENVLIDSGRFGLFVIGHTGSANAIFMNGTITNCWDIGVIVRNDAGALITNSIIYNNSGQTINYWTENSIDSVSIYNSNIEGGWFGPGSNNFSENPELISTGEKKHHLSDTSPCIGVGVDSVFYYDSWRFAPGYDMDKMSRPNPTGSVIDIGAYESIRATQHIPDTLIVPIEYSTIQSALNAADSLDLVLVQPGTYYENIIWPETNGITLMSAGDTSNTIIDGSGLGSVIYINPQTATIDTTTLISGFKITNGGDVTNGGGVLVNSASPRFQAIKVTENTASGSGGGIYLQNSNTILLDSRIENNSASSGGGMAASNSSPTLSECVVKSNNASDMGGGLFFRPLSDGIVQNSLIISNNASRGGGIGVEEYSNPEFLECTLEANIADHGGGFYLMGVSPIINSTLIIRNVGQGQGGGIWMQQSTPQLTDVKIINNTSDGQGGGMYVFLYSAPTLDQVEIIGNLADEGGAIYSHLCENQIIENSNIIENVSSLGTPGIYVQAGTPVITNCNILNMGTSIYNHDNANIIQAPNNYWGHLSGPYHSSQNPSGQGDSTNAFVNVTPWFTTPNTETPPIPTQNVSVSGTGNDFINLTWNPSPLGDFAGFKLYYDTDESGYPYESSVDAGVDTSFALSGLNLGTEYFLAVTVYDTDGNESWYSNEVTGVTRIMEVQNLDIAGDANLFHLITHDPLITFEYFDSMGEAQTNYQVQISTDSTFQSNMVWETGVVASDATSIQYSGGGLLDGVKYYLRAKVASGAFWSEWSNLAFGMNTEPSLPIQVSLVGDEVTTSDVLLEISNSSDAEDDNLTYDFRLFDATQIIQLDSAISVDHDPGGTEWEVTTALVDNSQHWWTVQAFDGYEYSELAGPESFLINFENDDPAAFDLTSPLLDESIINQSPLFTWNPAVDPDPLDTVRYVLYLDTPDPGGETFYPGIDTSFQLDYNLEDNTTYHWKVVAHDLNDSETESNGGYQSFTVNTANDLPEYFELLYPVFDEMVTNLQPEFLWEASSDPDDQTIAMRSRGKGQLLDQSDAGNSVDVITGYDFYLSTDSLLTDVIPVEVVGTFYSPEEDLLENQTYYWAVSALGEGW